MRQSQVPYQKSGSIADKQQIPLYITPMKTDGEQVPANEESEAPKANPEEQMADWEEALKNDDWGHQPC